MTGAVLLLVVGSALILSAALLGTARARALGSAQAGPALRLTVAGAGLLCAVSGLIVMGSDGSRQRAGPLRTAIVNELGPAQVSEEITVFLAGQHVGVIKVDQRSRKARLNVTVSKPGRYDYRLETRRQLKDKKKPITISDTGEVSVDRDGHLAIYSNDETQQTYLMAMR